MKLNKNQKYFIFAALKNLYKVKFTGQRYATVLYSNGVAEGRQVPLPGTSLTCVEGLAENLFIFSSICLKFKKDIFEGNFNPKENILH